MIKRIVRIICLLLATSAWLPAQGSEPQKNLKSRMEIMTDLKEVVAMSQTWTQWGLAMIGGTIMVLLSGSYRRPSKRGHRFAFILFLPAWACLGYSIYRGSIIQRAFGTLLMKPACKVDVIKEQARIINDAMAAQLSALQTGLLILSIWLMLFLCWWIMSEISPKGE